MARKRKKQENKPPRHLRVELPIRLEIALENQSFSTAARNVAMGGACFEMEQELAVDTQVNLLLYLPMAQGLELIKTLARVVWNKRRGKIYVIGTCFEQFAPGDQRRLQEWLLAYVRGDKESRFYPGEVEDTTTVRATQRPTPRSTPRR